MPSRKLAALYVLLSLVKGTIAFSISVTNIQLDLFDSDLWLTADQDEADVYYEQFSLCFNVNPLSPSPDYQEVPLILYKDSDNQPAEIAFVLEPERELSSLYIGGVGGAFFPTIPTTQWTHVCLSWDGNSGQVNSYFDGEPMIMAEGLQQGYRIPGNGYFVYGSEDAEFGLFEQLQFWNRVISPDEVQQHKDGSLKRIEENTMQNTASTGPCDSDMDEMPPGGNEVKTTDDSTCPANHPTTAAGGSLETNPRHKDAEVQARLHMEHPLPPLDAISMCSWIYVNNPDSYFNNSFTEFNQEHEVELTTDAGHVRFSLGPDSVRFEGTLENGKWSHVCITWSGECAVAKLFVDGQLTEKKSDFKKDYEIPSEVDFSLTDYLNSDVSESDDTAGYKYKMSDVNVWDRVITYKEVTQVYKCSGSFPGNLVNWDDTTWKKSIWCIHPQGTESADLNNSIMLKLSSTHPFALPFMDEVTVCAWFYKADAKSTIRALSVEHAQHSTNILAVDFDKNAIVFSVGLHSWTVPELKLEYGHWHHLCFTYSSHQFESDVYSNGELKATKTSFGNDTMEEGDFYLRQIQDGKSGFSFKVTDVHVWNHVITQEEVAKVFMCSAEFPGNIINWDNSTWVA